MILSNKLLLSDFVRKHSQAVKPLNAWVEKVVEAVWQSHNDVKATFPSADLYIKKLNSFCIVFFLISRLLFIRFRQWAGVTSREFCRMP